MKRTHKNEIAKRRIFYYRHRLKLRIFQKIAAYFYTLAKEKGLTQKQLADMTGKDPSVVNKLMSGPGNWRLDTISDILLAMDAELSDEIIPLSSYQQTAIEKDEIELEIGPMGYFDPKLERGT